MINLERGILFLYHRSCWRHHSQSCCFELRGVRSTYSSKVWKTQGQMVCQDLQPGVQRLTWWVLSGTRQNDGFASLFSDSRQLLDKISNALGWWAGHMEDRGSSPTCWRWNTLLPSPEWREKCCWTSQRETDTRNKRSCFFLEGKEKVF